MPGFLAPAQIGGRSYLAPAAAPSAVPDRTVSDADYAAWLDSDDAIPIVLVEAWPLVDGIPTLFCMSNLGYMTAGVDAPTYYEPAFVTGIACTEAMALTGGATVGASDLEIDNTDGIREGWREFVWKNRPIRQVYGDVRWARADFRDRFVGVSAGIAPKSDVALALHLRDMTERLNAPITEHKLGGDSLQQDAIIPLPFGEVHNVTGLWTNLNTLEDAFGDGPIEAIKEVRANALPVEVVSDLSTGRCVLTENNQSAAITASIQGDKYGGIYRTTISTIIQRLVTGFGKAGDRYTDADLDADNLAAFDADHPDPVGIYVNDRLNLLTGCDMLASSLGALLAPSRSGLLRLVQIAIPAAGVSMDVRPRHMAGGTLRPVQHIEPIAAVKLGFCKNWTVQTGLTTDIPAEHRALYETEWLTTTVVDAERQAELQLEGDPVQRNTMLLRRVDATAEAARELALWGPGRNIYEFVGTGPMLLLELGQPITVYHELYGMAAGVPAQVWYLGPNLEEKTVTVRFLA